MGSRNWLLLAVLVLAGFSAFIGYSDLTRPEETTAVGSVTHRAVLPMQRAEIDATPTIATNHESASQADAAPDKVAQWAVDAFDADPGKRVNAITALATAPKSQAVPVLQKVLNTGEAVDRPLALRSLRTLALQQGDGDGGIRDVFRQAIYDGRYEAITPDAQAALDDVESYFDKVRPDVSR
jgi:hypothetical protein